MSKSGDLGSTENIDDLDALFNIDGKEEFDYERELLNNELNVLRRDFIFNNIHDNNDDFNETIDDHILMVGKLSPEDILREQKLLEEKKLKELENIAEERVKTLEEVFNAENIAMDHIRETSKELLEIQKIREHEQIDRDKLRRAKLLSSYHALEGSLVRALSHRKGELTSFYGSLTEDRRHKLIADGYSEVSSPSKSSANKVYHIDWAEAPQPIEIKIHFCRDVGEKLPRGHFVILASIFTRIDGQRLTFDKFEGLDRASLCCVTAPRSHGGQIREKVLNFNCETLIVVAPEENRIRPSMCITFEMYMLRGPGNPCDKVIGWGVLPLCRDDLSLVNGAFRIPFLTGERSSEYRSYSSIHRMISENLDSWLCNLYVEVKTLPKYLAGQLQFEFQLNHTDLLLNVNRKDIPGSTETKEFDSSPGSHPTMDNSNTRLVSVMNNLMESSPHNSLDLKVPDKVLTRHNGRLNSTEKLLQRAQFYSDDLGILDDENDEQFNQFANSGRHKQRNYQAYDQPAFDTSILSSDEKQSTLNLNSSVGRHSISASLAADVPADLNNNYDDGSEDMSKDNENPVIIVSNFKDSNNENSASILPDSPSNANKNTKHDEDVGSSFHLPRNVTFRELSPDANSSFFIDENGNNMDRRVTTPNHKSISALDVYLPSGAINHHTDSFRRRGGYRSQLPDTGGDHFNSAYSRSNNRRMAFKQHQNVRDVLQSPSMNGKIHHQLSQHNSFNLQHPRNNKQSVPISSNFKQSSPSNLALRLNPYISSKHSPSLYLYNKNFKDQPISPSHLDFDNENPFLLSDDNYSINPKSISRGQKDYHFGADLGNELTALGGSGGSIANILNDVIAEGRKESIILTGWTTGHQQRNEDPSLLSNLSMKGIISEQSFKYGSIASNGTNNSASSFFNLFKYSVAGGNGDASHNDDEFNVTNNNSSARLDRLMRANLISKKKNMSLARRKLIFVVDEALWALVDFPVMISRLIWAKIKRKSEVFHIKLEFVHFLESWLGIILFGIWARGYLHYLFEWLILKAFDIPIYSLKPLVFPPLLHIGYSPMLAGVTVESIVLIIGHMGVQVVFALLAGVCWLWERTTKTQCVGVIYRSLLGLGVGMVLDLLLTLILDVIYRYGIVKTETVSMAGGFSQTIDFWGDFERLYRAFERSEGSGTIGILLYVLIGLSCTLLAIMLFYTYITNIHMSGAIGDLFTRLSSVCCEELYLTPDDNEISEKMLRLLSVQARNYQGLNGEVRATRVIQYPIKMVSNQLPSLIQNKYENEEIDGGTVLVIQLVQFKTKVNLLDANDSESSSSSDNDFQIDSSSNVSRNVNGKSPSFKPEDDNINDHEYGANSLLNSKQYSEEILRQFIRMADGTLLEFPASIRITQNDESGDNKNIWPILTETGSHVAQQQKHQAFIQ